jgi:hypothetical protein
MQRNTGARKPALLRFRLQLEFVLTLTEIWPDPTLVTESDPLGSPYVPVVIGIICYSLLLRGYDLATLEKPTPAMPSIVRRLTPRRSVARTRSFSTMANPL